MSRDGPETARRNADSRQVFRSYPPAHLLGPLTEIERVNVPKELFASGDLSLLRTEPRVSIVGSRDASREALGRAHRLAKELVKDGVVVVSGLARGIDTAAHLGAITGGGRTVAVLGTPLDRAYPKESADLQELIAREHLVISQFAPGTRTQRYHFPQRNRTMALISQATVIVEAGESSGSLSQGWEAIRLGRALFVMRALLGRRDLAWPKKMLDYGAHVLAESEDLLEHIPPPLGESHYAVPAF